MQNVIVFPKKAVPSPEATVSNGAKTLFLHIKKTTLIVHLAAQTTAVGINARVGKNS